jgi:hypothetical protein
MAIGIERRRAFDQDPREATSARACGSSELRASRSVTVNTGAAAIDAAHVHDVGFAHARHKRPLA